MSTYVIKTLEYVERKYSVEADSEEEAIKNIESGLNIVDDELITSIIRESKVLEIDE